MRNLKKLLAVVVAVCLLATFTVPAFAEGTVSPNTKTLGDIGVLVGTGAGVTAEYGATTPTRAQAAVILLKLTGNLAAAQAYTGTENFADADTAAWAKPLLGFLKTHSELGFVGDTAGNFNPNALITAQEYYKVLLTALGYAIPADYAYADTLTFAKDTAKLAMGGNVTPFTVDAAATAIVEALKGTIKGGTTTLVSKLVADGKLDAAAVKAAGLITELTVDKVAATSSKTVKVTFSKTVSSIDPSNFVVTLKDDQYAVQVIDSVSLSGNVASIKLVDSLSEDTDYSITTSDVKAADGTTMAAADVKTFTYTITEAASIAFAKTTYATVSAIEYVIKDANGVDITDNYTTDDLTMESSNASVVDETTFETVDAGVAIVNIKLDDTELETGNTIITVKDSLAVLTSLKLSLDLDTTDETGADFDKPTTSLYEKDQGDNQYVVVQALDASGDATTIPMDDVTLTFRSSNLGVANVGTSTGFIQPVSKGTATISVTAEYDGVKLTKTLAVEVKADPVVTSMKIDESSVKLVKPLDGNDVITETVHVTILDQYGDPIAPADPVEYKISKDNILDGIAKDAVQDDATEADTGKYEIALTPAVADKASATLTVTSGDLKKTVAVSLVVPGVLDHYTVSFASGSEKLDLMAEDANGYADLHQGDPTATFQVYAVDKDGNKLKDVSADATAVDANTTGGAVTVDGLEVSGNTDSVGKTEVVTVYKGVKIKSFTFTVVDSTKTLTTVKQVKNAVTVEAGDIATALFGSDSNGGAFVGYDQYGNKIVFDPADYAEIWTTDADVVDHTTASGTGTATLTLRLAGKIFNITVKVI